MFNVTFLSTLRFLKISSGHLKIPKHKTLHDIHIEIDTSYAGVGCYIIVDTYSQI